MNKLPNDIMQHTVLPYLNAYDTAFMKSVCKTTLKFGTLWYQLEPNPTLTTVTTYYQPNEMQMLKRFSTTKNGKRFGQYEQWHINGQKEKEFIYYYDKLQGELRIWWPNGQLRILCNYKDDKPVGTYKKWNHFGSLVLECEYGGEYRKYQKGKVYEIGFDYAAEPIN